MELKQILSEEELKARTGRGANGLDLAPYTAIVQRVVDGHGTAGVLGMAETDNQRAEKMRMSRAAKKLGYKLAWVRQQGADTLLFKLKTVEKKGA